MSSFVAGGFACPLVCFITWPTKKPNQLFRPAFESRNFFWVVEKNLHVCACVRGARVQYVQCLRATRSKRRRPTHEVSKKKTRRHAARTERSPFRTRALLRTLSLSIYLLHFFSLSLPPPLSFSFSLALARRLSFFSSPLSLSAMAAQWPLPDLLADGLQLAVVRNLHHVRLRYVARQALVPVHHQCKHVFRHLSRHHVAVDESQSAAGPTHRRRQLQCPAGLQWWTACYAHTHLCYVWCRHGGAAE